MITATLLGDKTLISKLKTLPENVRARVEDTVKKLGFELQARVQRDKLSGQVLKAPTGRLRASINPSEAESGDSRSRFESAGAQIYYYVGTNVEYAAQWEYGAPAKHIVPVKAKALAFNIGGEIIFRKWANIPALAARPFLAPTLQEMRPLIIEQLRTALKDATEASLK